MNKFGFHAARLSLTACLVSGLTPAVADEADKSGSEPDKEIVVTATRSGDGLDRNLLGSSVTVIDPRDFADRETRIVSDILRDIPGVAVNRSGAVGGLTQVRIRGTEGNHVLVFVDGIKASDAFQGEFDWATLIADDAARVEVLRGQQSALYGSDAIGGVINYTTLSGRDAPGTRLRAEGGSFGTYNGTARIAGTAGGTFDYALSGSFFHTNGYPTAPFHSVSVGPNYNSPTTPGGRDVGSESVGLAAKLDWTASDGFRLSGTVRYGHNDSDTNDSSPWGGAVMVGQIPVITTLDSDGVHYTNATWSGLVRAELDSLGGMMTTAVSGQYSETRRDGYDPFPYAYSNYYGDKGSRYRGSLENTLRFGGERIKHILTLAMDAEREEYRNLAAGTILSDKHSFDTVGFVGQYRLILDNRLSLGGSVRFDQNEFFKDDATWHLDASYLLPTGTRLHAAAGKGVKNPGAIELHGYFPPFVGNPDLKPEQSVGWELGVDQSFLDGAATIGATYFKSRLTDWIQSCVIGGNSSVCNSGPITRQQGVELFGQARLGELRIDLAYTYLDAPQTISAVLNPDHPVTGYGAGPSFSDPIPVGYDFATSGLVGPMTVQSVRRPESTASANLSWAPANLPVSGTLTVRYNGRMKDYAFDTYYNYILVNLKAFTLVNLSLRYKVAEKVEFFARTENLFDEDYQEVFTVEASGRTVYGGLRLRF